MMGAAVMNPGNPVLLRLNQVDVVLFELMTKIHFNELREMEAEVWWGRLSMWPVHTCDGPANLEGTSRRYVPHIRKWSPSVVGDKVMMLVMDGSIMGPSTDGAEFPQPTLVSGTFLTSHT